ncbi:MAM and LDL-receptor class A domain-containing protein 1-like isoform X2 [Antedon mediterranea]|uniref:MAM and LDL-receptor class A domain-containing protein 1-like isoform X2 n=1 Tax=Antedon mediterranea TaxID=105859 RepID=UPI003AF8EF3F
MGAFRVVFGGICFLLSSYFTDIVNGTAKPLTCNFESADSRLCQWQQMSADDFNWTPQSGQTASSNTGPRYGDHTYGSSSGHYLYIEATNVDPNANARIISPVIDPLDSTCAMTYYYNMYGQHIGSLHVYVVVASDQSESEIWSIAGTKGSSWIGQTLIFNVTYKFQVIIEAVRGSGYAGDIAIDDISFSNTCEKFGNGSLRIVKHQQSSYTNQGRIDVYINGNWRSICNRNFDLETDGIVACIQLGYRKADSSPTEYLVFDDQDPIIDNIQCFGNETSLLDCGNDGVGVINTICDATTVVNLKCSDIIDRCEDIGNDAFPCDNIHCVPSGEKCDFANNCGDNSDEERSICEMYPGRNSFQTDFGEWANVVTNGIDWSRTYGQSSIVGPSADHNDQTTGYFLLLDASSNVGKKAQLCYERKFEANSIDCSVRFYYYRNIATAGEISLILRTTSPSDLWTISSTFASYSQWGYEDISINASESFHVCFEAVIPTTENGYLGLDDLSLTPGCIIASDECELTGPIFTCDDGLCIHYDYICDHIHHCFDASDENATLCEDHVGYCTFENGFCDWKQSVEDDLEWIMNSGGTPSQGTGPSVDHTLENQFGSYAYLETSYTNDGDYADLVSPWLYYSDSCDLRLYFHMEGQDVEHLEIGTSTRTSASPTFKTERFSRNFWRYTSLSAADNNVPINTDFQFIIRATADGPMGDIAIDDISLSAGCILAPGRSTSTASPSTSTASWSTASRSTTTVSLLTSTTSQSTLTASPSISTASRSTSTVSRSTSTVRPTKPTEKQRFTTSVSKTKKTITKTMCKFYIETEESFSYDISCNKDFNMIITVTVGDKICSWTIRSFTESDKIQIKLNGMNLADDDQLTVKDEGNDNAVKWTKDRKEWSSKTNVVNVIFILTSDRLKRNTEVDMPVYQLDIESLIEDDPHNFPVPAIAIIVIVLIVVALTVLVLIVKFKGNKRKRQPGLTVQYQNGNNVHVQNNDIYNVLGPAEHLVDDDCIKHPYDVELPNVNKDDDKNSKRISANEYVKMDGTNVYAQMLPSINRQQLPTISGPNVASLHRPILPPIHAEPEYLVPSTPPPKYEEIQIRGFDNFAYHGHEALAAKNNGDKKVFKFLKNIDLDRHAKSFKDSFVVFDDIPYIEAEELKDMGLNKTEIKRFLRNAKEVKKQKMRGAFDDVTVPSDFLCPISRSIMTQPVTAADGVTYEFKNIDAYLQSKITSPITKEPLANKTLSPNIEIADKIQKFQMKIENERRRKQRQMRREASDLGNSRPQTPMTDVDC